MGLDKLTTAFGQLIILHGLAVIIGTPVAGLYDTVLNTWMQSNLGYCIRTLNAQALPTFTTCKYFNVVIVVSNL